MKKLLLVFALGLAVTGCKKHVVIVNGELTDGMVPYANRFMGEYDGKFDGRPLRLSLAMQGKKVVLHAAADWLSADCSSAVGDLQEVYVKNKKNQNTVITQAIFAFDAGKCASQVWGRQLEISLKDKTPLRLTASLYGGSYTRWTCDPGYPGPYYPGPGYYPPGYYPPGWGPGYPYGPVCRNVVETYWLTGSFRKL